MSLEMARAAISRFSPVLTLVIEEKIRSAAWNSHICEKPTVTTGPFRVHFPKFGEDLFTEMIFYSCLQA